MSNGLEMQDVNNKKNIIQKLLTGYKLEWLVLGLYVILYIVVTRFHEPWFDEAQAWQIARCASVKDILFTIPHYEGHPALWNFLLVIPAKLGLPYEISLKTIGGLIGVASTTLFLFKAPFKRWFKLLFPFTFFAFYQYGIIVRPYGLMFLLIVLLAITFNKRNEKPWIFVGLLIVLCLCSAYGILISGGIAIAWVIDILKEKKISETLKSLFTTKRMWALWVLLGAALIICYQILPREDTLATNFIKRNSFGERLICALFAFLPDVFFTENKWSINDELLIDIEFNVGNLLLFALFGLLIWLVIWVLSTKRTFKYFAIPYVLFAVFSASVYFSSHHIGLISFLLVFWGWITCTENGRVLNLQMLIDKFTNKATGKKLLSEANVKLAKVFVGFIEVIAVLLSIYWSISSSVLDAKIEFSFGREAAAFIKEHSMEDLLIISEWGYNQKDYNDFGNEYVNDVYYMHIPVNIYPYFDKEIVANMEEGYVTHIYTTEEICNEKVEEWSKLPYPDVLLGYVDLNALYDGEISRTDYSPVFKLETNIIWRGTDYKGYNYIYVRNDLLEQHGLTSLYDGITVAD